MYSIYGNDNLALVNPNTRPKIVQVQERGKIRDARVIDLTDTNSQHVRSLFKSQLHTGQTFFRDVLGNFSHANNRGSLAQKIGSLVSP
jgi:hypothetical protein